MLIKLLLIHVKIYTEKKFEFLNQFKDSLTISVVETGL